MKFKIFEVYDTKTNSVEFEGTSSEISRHFKVSYIECVEYVSKNKMYKKRYSIKDTGRFEERELKKSKYNDDLTEAQIIRNHLEMYGNYYLKDNPEDYKKELKEMGYEYTYRREFDGKGYILERAN